MKRIRMVLVCAALAAAAACDSTPTTPTSEGGVTSATQVFAGTIAPGDTPSHTFSLPGLQPLHLMLGSLTTAAGAPLPNTVTLQLGVSPAVGEACSTLTSVPATAALRAQLNVSASAGVYCVSLADTGGLPVAANYAIRVIYGTPSDADSSGTITYASTLLPGGFTARSFPAAVAGVASITLDSFSPANVATLGLGIGFQRGDGSGCEVATTTIASRGTVLSVPVDAGTYCVRVFDPGTLSETASFSLRILHP